MQGIWQARKDRGRGQRLEDIERASRHYGITPEEYLANPEAYPLPERGTGLSQGGTIMRGRTTISAIAQAEQVVRDYIGQGEVTIPTWLFAGGVGLVLGIIIGPSIMAMTEEGSKKLAELSRQYVRK